MSDKGTLRVSETFRVFLIYAGTFSAIIFSVRSYTSKCSRSSSSGSTYLIHIACSGFFPARSRRLPRKIRPPPTSALRSSAEEYNFPRTGRRSRL